jgi:hypothetical protein
MSQNSATVPTPEKSRRTLCSIADDLEALDDLIVEREGDITDCEPIVNQWFESLGDEVTTKLDGYAAYIRELEARSQARKEEAERLAKRARLDASLAAFLKERMKQFFQMRGWKKLETPRYRLSLANNGGVLPLDITCPVHDLPEEYRIDEMVSRPNVERIRADLEAGTPLPFACLGERGQRISIR